MSAIDENKKTGRTPGDWVKRILRILVIIEIVWVAVINAALFLPVTQDLINSIKPEKFQARWERAWSLYPGHLTAVNAFANGQSRRQQWQASVDRISARVSLIPLIAKRVNINWGEAQNADYRQRPRLKPDVNYDGLLEHFPEIEGYPVTAVSDVPLPDRRPWKVHLEDLQVSGSHKVWIMQFQVGFDAEIAGGLDIESRGGPFELDLEEIDLALTSASVNSDHSMIDEGRIKGSLGFAPFSPRENKGLPMLQYLIADLDLSLNTQGLDYINLFLLNFEAVSVAGSGALNGRLVYDRGEVMPGTDLHVDADDLRVRAVIMEVYGTGDIDLAVEDSEDEPLILDFSFRDLLVQHDDDDTPMLEGESLGLRLSGSRSLAKDLEDIDMNRTMSVSIDDLAVPDLARFQRFVPAKWPFILHGGTGKLHGTAVLGPNVLSADLQLSSDQADLGLRQYRFDTNLDAALRLENPDIQHQPTQLSGTYFKLTDSRLANEDGAESNPWEASLEIGETELSLVPQTDKNNEASSFDLLRLLGDKQARDLLADSAGELNFEAYVSSLGFLNVLLSGSEPAQFQGDGKTSGRVVLSSGLPAAGTKVELKTDALGVKVLDYLAQGDGTVELTVEEGGEFPDWRLAVRLDDGHMRRAAGGEPGIEQVQLQLDALVEDVSFEPRDRSFEIRFQIPSALVTDMTIFNGYFPPDAPLSFASGTADLVVDLNLKEDDAKGFVRLYGDDIDVDLDGQAFEADLLANMLVVGGTPSEMMFDLAGSTIAVENVEISGEDEDFDDETWSARLTLDQADVTWNQPPTLDVGAQLYMSDTRPFVALVKNNGGSRLVGRMLSTGEVNGLATLTAKDNRMRIPSAEVTSEDITVGMKGLITEAEREGMIFMRWKAVRALLKVNDGKKNLDVINSRSTFDAYEPPE